MSAKGRPSNNPNGRPPKARALTALLAGELARKPENSLRTYGEILAEMRVQAALTGTLTLFGTITVQGKEEANTRVLGIDEILTLQADLYKQIDGPPKGELDVTTRGKPIRAARTTINLKALSDDDLDTLAALRQKAEGRTP